MIWVVVVIWVLCSVLAYGSFKRGIRDLIAVDGHKYGYKDELLITAISVGGPIILLVMVIEDGLCFKMPERLCEKRPK